MALKKGTGTGRRVCETHSVDLVRFQHARPQYRHADSADGIDPGADIQSHLGHSVRSHVNEFQRRGPQTQGLLDV